MIRKRTELQGIELVVFIAMMLSVCAAQASASAKPVLDIDVTGVTRLSSGLFEIHYALRNTGATDIYLPYHEIARTLALTTYTLL
jgi:hypothetical protein